MKQTYIFISTFTYSHLEAFAETFYLIHFSISNNRQNKHFRHNGFPLSSQISEELLANCVEKHSNREQILLSDDMVHIWSLTNAFWFPRNG